MSKYIKKKASGSVVTRNYFKTPVGKDLLVLRLILDCQEEVSMSASGGRKVPGGGNYEGLKVD